MLNIDTRVFFSAAKAPGAGSLCCKQVSSEDLFHLLLPFRAFPPSQRYKPEQLVDPMNTPLPPKAIESFS